MGGWGFSGVLRGEGRKGKFSQKISAGPRLTNTLKWKISCAAFNIEPKVRFQSRVKNICRIGKYLKILNILC